MHPRRCRLVAAVAGALLVVAGASASTGSRACTSPAGPAACPDPASQANVGNDDSRALVALWNARERALDSNDVALLQQVETGTAALYDGIGARSARARVAKPFWTKGPRVIDVITQLWVPPHLSYPRYFMGGVEAARSGTFASTSGVTAYLVFTQAGPDDPWRIAARIYDQGYSTAPGAQLAAPTLATNGYDAPPADPAPAVAAKWPAELAAYYMQLKREGSPPAGTPFAPGPLTTLSGLSDRRQGFTTTYSVSHYRFEVGDGPWIMNSGGRPLVCADIYEEITTTPLFHDLPFRQPADRSSWGVDLAPGYYSSIVDTEAWPACITPWSTGGLGVVGTKGYGIKVVGVRLGVPPRLPSPSSIDASPPTRRYAPPGLGLTFALPVEWQAAEGGGGSTMRFAAAAPGGTATLTLEAAASRAPLAAVASQFEAALRKDVRTIDPRAVVSARFAQAGDLPALVVTAAYRGRFRGSLRQRTSVDYVFTFRRRLYDFHFDAVAPWAAKELALLRAAASSIRGS